MRRSSGSVDSVEARPRERRRSFGSTVNGIITVLPLIAGVFMFGVLVGSTMVREALRHDSVESPVRRTLRGSVSNKAVSSQETSLDKVVEAAPIAKVVMANEVIAKKEKPSEVMKESWSATGHRVSSLRCDAVRFAEALGPIEAADTTIGAWIYLDGADRTASIKTIASNKASGCDTGSDGIALAINEWETEDRQLMLEWGDVNTGCRKLGSGIARLEYDTWTHVAASLSRQGEATLYINGEAAARSDIPVHRNFQKVTRMRLGQYPDGTHNFIGNISSFFAIDGIMDTEWVRNLAHSTKPGDADFATSMLKTVIPSTHLLAAFPFLPSEIKESAPAYAKVELHLPMYQLSSSSALVTGQKYAMGLSTASTNIDAATAKQRATAVRDAMAHAWSGYKSRAWGRDELKPVSGRGHDNWGGLAVTMVDSLDTLWLMGLKDEFREATAWIGSNLRFDNTGQVSVFETTIRELGGLLSAYDLSKDSILLNKATDLARRLLHAFDTPTGIPTGSVSLRDQRGKSVSWSGGNAVLAELGSLQLEFRYLAAKTQDATFATKVNNVFERVTAVTPANGLVPIYISTNSGQLASRKVTFGALGDSYYEYLLKTWLQGGKTETRLRDAYDAAINGMIAKLVHTSSPSNLVYVADLENGNIVHKMDHLVCFLPGVLALGAYTDPLGLEGTRAQRDLDLAKGLAYTCYQMYERTATKLAPEWISFRGGRDFVPAPSAPFNILRPETAESLFVLHHLTGDPTYREWAWQIFQAFESHCRTTFGYGAHPDVRDSKARKPDDRMESFFLAETLKYLYLVQAPDHEVDLMRSVFNTEAHPLSNLGATGNHISTALKRRV